MCRQQRVPGSVTQPVRWPAHTLKETEMFLGINYSGMHDSSVCLVDGDGNVVYAVSEERFTRVKQDGRFPYRALAAVELNAVSVIGVPYLAEAAAPISSDDIFRTLLHPLPGY